MQIDAILERKGREVVTVPSSASIREAVGLLASAGIGALVVSDDGRHPDGLLGEHTLVAKLALHGEGLLALPVSAVMTRLELTCLPSDEIEAIQALMTRRRIRHVPVVEGGVLAGLVSIGDVVANRIAELAAERAALEQYVSAR